MTMTDPIADFLTRIRNANMVRHETVEVPASKIKINLAQILKDEGFINDYQVIDTPNKQGFISLTLKYGPNREHVITGLKRISKPGLRSYVQADSVPKVLNGLGIAILSTSEGVMTDKSARSKMIGGEVIAYIW
ncbi:30S ribosomal protein S8 [Oenococcus sicerae]|uniref:Small ribosomal subunit protein uS8 n=1 Tax=Oenococcus sicerae TaxID=2203724 RepID=A0AAJ1RCB4_9LACO|nr:30S ribosomal protein S8 [Oenococcus sicerae]MDN6901018.1 30S ribosomal protein S8 [Oenococcus sicerae]QAS70053.1 30S ribosomal protein S8 [Oenococcus sicerae]